jgi:hypothetical protein
MAAKSWARDTKARIADISRILGQNIHADQTAQLDSQPLGHIRVTEKLDARHRSPDEFGQRSCKDDQLVLIGCWSTRTRVPSITSSPSRPPATDVLADLWL